MMSDEEGFDFNDYIPPVTAPPIDPQYTRYNRDTYCRYCGSILLEKVRDNHYDPATGKKFTYIQKMCGRRRRFLFWTFWSPCC
jgi:hypothetical protein